MRHRPLNLSIEISLLYAFYSRVCVVWEPVFANSPRVSIDFPPVCTPTVVFIHLLDRGAMTQVERLGCQDGLLSIFF